MPENPYQSPEAEDALKEPASMLRWLLTPVMIITGLLGVLLVAMLALMLFVAFILLRN